MFDGRQIVHAEEEKIAWLDGFCRDFLKMSAGGVKEDFGKLARLIGDFSPVRRVGGRVFGDFAEDAPTDSENKSQTIRARADAGGVVLIGRAEPSPRLADDLVSESVRRHEKMPR